MPSLIRGCPWAQKCAVHKGYMHFSSKNAKQIVSISTLMNTQSLKWQKNDLELLKSGTGLLNKSSCLGNGK